MGIPYVPTNWTDDAVPALNAANLQHIERGVELATDTANAALVAPTSPTTDGPVYWDGAEWVSEKLTASQISASAAIAYSQLSLAASIVDGDIAAGTNLSKLAGVTGTPNGTKFLRDDGSWQAIGATTPPGTELDYKTLTTASSSITATTEGTSVAVITGNAITYSGSRVLVIFFCPKVVTSTTGVDVTLVFYRDTTVLGQVDLNAGNQQPNEAATVSVFDTPAAGSHTYAAKAFVSSGNVVLTGGAGGSGNLVPAYLRVVQA